MTNIKELPLVSIIVLTYNSSKYVLETLESAKTQTYQNIELIISDDCSTDNTLEFCKEWLEQNKERFVRTELITVEKNTGIAPNCNRGLYAAKGEWVKFIAGDDLLIDKCIDKCVNYTLNNEDCKVLFSRIYYLKDNKLFEDTIPAIFQMESKKQYLKTITGSSIKAPSSFLSTETLKSINGFDEKYPFIEDVPLWIRLSKQKYHFYLLEKFLVIYRVHDENISMNYKAKNYINLLYFESNRKLLKKVIIPELKKKKLFLNIINCYKYLVIKNMIIFLGNKNNLLSKLIDNIFYLNSYKKIFKKIFKNEQAHYNNPQSFKKI